MVIEPTDDGLFAWRWPWGSAHTLGLLAAAYGISENQATEDANGEQKKIVEKLDASPTAQEFDALSRKLENEEDASQKHQENASVGIFTSLVLLGAAAWIYFDPPQASTAALNPIPYLYAHYDAHHDSLQVGLVMSW